jgi:hypothetical protein
MHQTRTIDTELCIIGGGMSGICAAISAARNGAQVVLVQDRSVLGGNASSEIKMHIVGADCHGGRPGARETGLIEELRLEDAVRNPHRSYSQWDLLLYEKVIAEPNIKLLLNTIFTSCMTETTADGKKVIRSVSVIRHATEEAFVIKAKFFADCSGDGVLGAEAGADFRVGRESKSEFGESLALDKTDAHTLGSSILFTARRHDSPQNFITPSWVRRFQKHEFKHRPIFGYEYGYWWSEWGGQLDTIRDSDAIRHELLRIALGIWDYIKNSGEHPDSANWALDWVGAIPGKRESRRFLGPHVLTQDDILTGRVFDDQVAYGGWWLDLHPPSGVDAIEESPCIQHEIPYLYTIPLRCLYSRNVANLFFAGRNISATHVAFASTRVMSTCAMMGQAVGTTAALLRTETSDIAIESPSRLRDIQQALLKDDVFLLDVPVSDKADMARQGEIQASSELSDAPAASIRNGVARRVDKAWGTWAESKNNHWQSLTLPAWIGLEWPDPIGLSEIHLTFCTGLDRELILTPSDRVTSKVVRGPQPETVRDYDVILDGNRVLQIRGNYQRKRKHVLDRKINVKSLRIEVLASNGLPAARIFEIRAY